LFLHILMEHEPPRGGLGQSLIGDSPQRGYIWKLRYLKCPENCALILRLRVAGAGDKRGGISHPGLSIPVPRSPQTHGTRFSPRNSHMMVLFTQVF
jgi:hypothetical protein